MTSWIQKHKHFHSSTKPPHLSSLATTNYSLLNHLISARAKGFKWIGLKTEDLCLPTEQVQHRQHPWNERTLLHLYIKEGLSNHTPKQNGSYHQHYGGGSILSPPQNDQLVRNQAQTSKFISLPAHLWRLCRKAGEFHAAQLCACS